MSRSQDPRLPFTPASLALPCFACVSLCAITGCNSSKAAQIQPSGDPFEGTNTAVARIVYVGTYTNGPPGRPALPDGGVDNGTPPSQGIYVFKSDPTDGSLTQVQVVQASNPSYLALDSTNKFLYSDNEDGTGMYVTDMKGGNVSAYSIGADGMLTFLNSLRPRAIGRRTSAFTPEISLSTRPTMERATGPSTRSRQTDRSAR